MVSIAVIFITSGALGIPDLLQPYSIITNNDIIPITIILIMSD